MSRSRAGARCALARSPVDSGGRCSPLPLRLAALVTRASEEKHRFLPGARALLFPIDWPEPFGLVLIEALACGTPVIAFRRGSVPEIVEDGRTGFIVDDVEGAVRAVERLDEIDRERCRAAFEERFSATRMAADYLHIYETLLGGSEQRTDMRPVASLQGA